MLRIATQSDYHPRTLCVVDSQCFHRSTKLSWIYSSILKHKVTGGRIPTVNLRRLRVRLCRGVRPISLRVITYAFAESRSVLEARAMERLLLWPVMSSSCENKRST